MITEPGAAGLARSGRPARSQRGVLTDVSYAGLAA